MGSGSQRESGPRTSWYQSSEWTHAGQEEGGLKDAFSICRAILRWDFFPLPWRGKQGGRHFQAVFSRIFQLRLTAGSHWAPDQRQSPATVGVGGSGGREPNNDEDEEEEG